MSTASTTASLPRRHAGTGVDDRPGLARLTGVELRKMTDTRSGFWLLLTVLGLSLVVVVISCVTGSAADRTFATILGNALAPATILLPVVGILLVCAEWSQRTALITFTLVPNRGRILAAKIFASLTLTGVAFVVCIVLAAVGAAFGSAGVDDTWTLSAPVLGQDLLALVLAMLVGVAFGAVILSPAPAIVLYFALPMAFLALGSLSALESIAPWVDQARASDPLTNHLLSSTEWARLGTAMSIWLVAPLVAGLWRFRNSEIR